MALLPMIVALISILHQCNACHAPCSFIGSVTLTNSFTVIPLGSTVSSGSFTCSFTIFNHGCCSATVKWLKGSTVVNSALQYAIMTQNTLNSYYYGTTIFSYTSTLSVNGIASASHAGSYHCEAVSSLNSNMITRSSSSLYLTVKIPQPSLSISTSTVPLGSTASLICVVTLQHYSNYSSVPLNITVNLLQGSITVMTNSTPSGSGSVRTSVFTLSNVGVSNVGWYRCRATVSTTYSNVIDSTPGVSHSYLLTAQIPPPSLGLTNTSVPVSSTASLTCTVTLQQYSSYSSILSTITVKLLKGSTTVMTNSTPSGSGAVRTSVFTFSNVGVSSVGQYQCRATVSNTHIYVINSIPGISNNAIFAVQIPPPSLTLTNTSVFMGSIAFLTCTATLTQYSSYSTISNIVHFGLYKENMGLYNVSISGFGEVRTRQFNFLNNGVSTASHQYQCRATVSNTNTYIVSSNVAVSNYGALTVQIPPPSITLSGTFSVSVGSTAYLTCTVTLLQYSSYSSIPLNITVDLLKEGTVVTSFTAPGSGSNLFKLYNIGVSTAGLYKCRVTVSTNQSSVIDSTPGFSNNATLTPRIPKPLLSFTGTSVLVGSTASLTCTVTLQQHSSYSSIPLNIMVELLKGSTTVMTSSTPSGSGSVRTSVFALSNVGISSVGWYRCRATVSTTHSNVIDSTLGVSNIATLTTQVPSPSVILSDNVAVLGSPATLQCTVMLPSSLTCSGPIAVTVDLIKSNTAIATQPAEGPGSTCNTTLTVSTNALSSNGGSYRCRVRLSYFATNSAFISLPAHVVSSPATLYVVDSTVMSTPSTVLNTSPYNNFTLTCTVTTNPATTLIAYQWTGISVTSVNSATITVFGSTPGQSLYQCSASVAQLSTVSTANTTVTVRGPAPPNVPVNVSAISTGTINNVSITFTITSVTYTPETYSVQYGTTPGDLDQTSSNTAASVGVDTIHSFLTILQRPYTITLHSLSIGTMYYYKVLATNSISSVTTNLLNFSIASPPGPPSNVHIIPQTSKSLLLSWDLPTQPNGVITGYNYSCYQIVSNEITMDSVTSTSALIVGLLPNTQYYCSVSASTLAGVGPSSATVHATTYEDVPGSPANVSVTALNQSTLTLQWKPPLVPNGIITMYRYGCAQLGARGEGGGGHHDEIPQLMDKTITETAATVTGLAPYTSYECTVYASTKIGEGPGASSVGTTEEDFPGTVTDFRVIGESSRTFKVYWSSPVIDNGEITRYTITVTFYTNSTIVYQGNETAVNNDDHNEYSLTVTAIQLIQYVPYNVSVTAFTSAGEGPEVKTTAFTKEGAPTAVHSISSRRINNTAVVISWDPLTLTQARGFLTNYTITLSPVSLSRGIITRTVPASQSMIVVTDLEPELLYYITVAGSTSVGLGLPSDIIISAPLNQTHGTQTAHTSTTLIVAIVAPLVLLICVCVIATCIVVAVLLACKKKANRKITSPKKTKGKELDDDNYELFNIDGNSHIYEIAGNKNSLPIKKAPNSCNTKGSNIYMNIYNM